MKADEMYRDMRAHYAKKDRIAHALTWLECRAAEARLDCDERTGEYIETIKSLLPEYFPERAT